MLVVKPSRNAGVCGPTLLLPEFPAFEACERRRQELYQKPSWAGGQVDNLEGRDPRRTFEQWKTGGPWLFLGVLFWGEEILRAPVKWDLFHQP